MEACEGEQPHQSDFTGEINSKVPLLGSHPDDAELQTDGHQPDSVPRSPGSKSGVKLLLVASTEKLGHAGNDESKFPLLVFAENDDENEDDLYTEKNAVPSSEVAELIDPFTDINRNPYFPSKLAALTMNLSFAGCGFLGIYHLGVVKALAQHGGRLLLNTQKFAGASAGSLVAAALAIRGTDPEIIQRSTDFVYKLALDTRRRKLGAMTPGVSLLEPVEAFLRELLPDNGYELATDRLFVSVTRRRGRKSMVVSKFESNEHLLQCLMASSYIPYVTGSKTVYVAAERFVDGGMTDNLPIPESGRTIRVSPFAGKQEICPDDSRGRQWFTRINKQDFQVNADNLVRTVHALFPPKRKYLERYHRKGYGDAVRFLKKEGFYTDGQSGVNVECGQVPSGESSA